MNEFSILMNEFSIVCMFKGFVCRLCVGSPCARYFNATSIVFQWYFDAFGALKYRLYIEKQMDIKRTRIGLIANLLRTYCEPIENLQRTYSEPIANLQWRMGEGGSMWNRCAQAGERLSAGCCEGATCWMLGAEYNFFL